MRHACSNIVTVEKQWVIYTLPVCIFSFRYPACKCARAILSYVFCPAIQYLSKFSHKWHVFRKMLLNKKFVFWLSLTLMSETRAEVSSSAPYLLHNRLLISPIKLQLSSQGVMSSSEADNNPDCVLLQDSILVLAAGLEPGINFRIYLWVLIRTCLKAILFM
jgi:hypothetical protein